MANLNALDMSQISETSSLSDPISSKLAAIHDVVRAVRSLRIEQQLQNAPGDLVKKGDTVDDNSFNKSYLCDCGDPYCLDIRDIRQWLPESELDQRMQNLVLQLEESYLALGEAYKEDQQLDRALDTVKVACSFYDSYPQHLVDARFIPSMVNCSSSQLSVNKGKAVDVVGSNLPEDGCSSSRFSPNLFLAKAWSLSGDVYSSRAIHHWICDEAFQVQAERKTSGSELRISNRVKKGIEQSKKPGKNKPFYISCKSSALSSKKEASAMRGVAASSNRKKPNRRQNNLSRTKQPRSASIIDYLESIKYISPEKDLLAAIHCYEAAIKAVCVSSSESAELRNLVMNKKALSYKKLACYRVSVGGYNKTAIADARDAWSEVSGHRNIIKLNCEQGLFVRTYANHLAKCHEKYDMCDTRSDRGARYLQIAESLHDDALVSYMDALKELSSAGDEADPPLRDMVHAGLDETYKSLADLQIRKAAFSHFRQGCYRRDTCLIFMNVDQNEVDRVSSNKTNHQIAEQYAYFAEEHWQDAIILCTPEEHPVAYLTILLELSTLCSSLYSFASYLMKEAALFHLLEARHIAEVRGCQPFPDPGVEERFWNKLKALLLEMCKMYSKPLCGNGSGVSGQESASKRSLEKLKKMYMKSITLPTFTVLHEIHREWFSETTS